MGHPEIEETEVLAEWAARLAAKLKQDGFEAAVTIRISEPLPQPTKGGMVKPFIKYEDFDEPDKEDT